MKPTGEQHPSPKERNEYGEKMIHTQASTIKEAYLKNLQAILREGQIIHDERGEETLEIQNLHTTIEFNNHWSIPPRKDYLTGSIWNNEKLKDYCHQILDGEDKGFIYDYGNRLRGHDIDQIQNIISQLNKCRETRRAVAVTYRPTIDHDREEIPCMMMIDIKIRGAYMTLTAVFRSNDMYGASYSNLNGLYAIAEHINKNLNNPVKIKSIECHHISAHIYRNDWESAQKTIRQNGGII